MWRLLPRITLVCQGKDLALPTMLRVQPMSKNKAKGTSAETAVVNYLIARGYVHAERRALAGVNDKGDVAGLPGVCIEVKAHKTYSIPAWLKELAVEKVNAKAQVGFLVVKPVGVGSANTGAWWAIMPLEQAVDLLDKAGAGR
jgi:hypothetical protein